MLASQGGGAWASAAPSTLADDGADRAQQIVERAALVVELLAEADTAVREVDVQSAMGATDPRTIAALIGRLDQAKIRIARASARLRAMPAWTGNAEEDQLARVTTQDAIVYMDAIQTLIVDMRQLLVVAQTGNAKAMQQATVALLSGANKMIVGQALTARTRASMLPKDSSDRQVMLGQAEVYEGLAGVFQYMVGSGGPGEATKAARGAESRIRRAVALGREAEASQAEFDRALLHVALKDKAISDAFELQHRMQLESFLSLERSADTFGAIAGKLEAAGGKRVHLREDIRPLEHEEQILGEILQRQIAAFQDMTARLAAREKS